MTGYFSFTIFAHDLGVAKPDPRFYERAAEAIGVATAQVLHVGDSLVNDVASAQAAGMTAIWLKRSGRPNLMSIQPYAEIVSLADLPPILEQAARHDVPTLAG